jgi:hypothetical protein
MTLTNGKTTRAHEYLQKKIVSLEVQDNIDEIRDVIVGHLEKKAFPT